MNDSMPNQNTGEPGVPPVIKSAQASDGDGNAPSLDKLKNQQAGASNPPVASSESTVPPVITNTPTSAPPLPPHVPVASLFLPRSPAASLKEMLLRIAARQNRLRLWTRLAACWALVALFGICVVILQRQNGWSSSLSVAIVAAVGILSAVVIIVRSRRREPDLRALAMQIEARHTDLDGLLLTAVQQETTDTRELHYLQERLIREATIHNHRRNWAEIVPNTRLALAQLANVAALVVLVLVLGKLRATGGHSPLAHVPEAELSVSPGDTSLERGSSLVVLARFGHSLPPNVVMVIEPEHGPEAKIPLVKSLADPVFGGSVPEVTSNFAYRIEYGGRQSRDFKVTVFDYPRLERADADVTYPDYTGEKPKHIENTRRVTAVEGSHVSFGLQFNKPVTSARLVAKNDADASIPLTLETDRPGAVLKEFPLATNATYDLQLVDADGRTNKVRSQFVFAVLTNRTPELRLASPRGDTRPSPLEEISFDGTVWDDFGVKAYGLGYQLAGEEPKYVQLGGAVPAKEKRTFQYVLPLEKLGVRPDQLISWFVWADDVAPDGEVRRTPGDLFFGEVRPFDEVFREGQGMEGQAENGQRQNQPGGGQGGGQTGRLAELQKQIISATWRLQRENAAKRPAASGDKKPAAQANPNRDQSSANPELKHIYLATVPQFAGQLAPGQNTRRGRGNSGRQPASTAANSALNSADDTTVVRDAQQQALEQAQETMQQQQDPQTAALWSAAVKRMEDALKNLEAAKNSPSALPQALTEEQAAYQALLKLQEHEFNVVRSRNNRGGGGGARSQQMQRQLDQLDLTQPENRYETQRQAQAPQTQQNREQLQVMNRLQELARRQQDLNQRLKELQTELQEARTPQEREDAQRRLKRLQEEEQQMLADVDELRQRMDRPENQSSMSDARQQLEQTRNDIQRAANAANQNDPSQALASGTRAQQQLQELRDQFRKENSSQFADDLRDMRSEARELARQQEDVLNKMQQEAGSDRKSLTDSPDRKAMLDQLAQQTRRMTNLVDRATQISQQAETSEPLLSQQLYDTVRTFSQSSAKDVSEVQNQLLNRGIMTRDIYDELKDTSKNDGAKLLDVTSELVRMDFLPQANDTGQRSRASIDDLRRGIERAAGSVLGDDTEALRQAQQQLDQLTDQLRNEIARGQGGGTNGQPSQASNAGANRGGGNGSTNDEQRAESPNGGQRRGELARAGNRASQRGDQARGGQNGGQGGEQNQDEQNQSAGQQADSGQQGGQQNQQANAGGEQNQQANGGGQRNGNRGSNQNNPNGGGRNGRGNQQPQLAQNDRRGGQRGGGLQRGGNRGGANSGGGGWGGEVGNVVDQLLNPGPNQITAPLTGGDFVPWSDSLRDVEQMIEIPDLRNDVAVARERARLLRQQFRQTGKTPDWAVVKLDVLKPLVEVRNQIANELARRESREALVPIDRDPVPTRYSELVQHYYEQLGNDQTTKTEPQAK